ncbi:MFS transporter [Agrobacterium sp. Ap1]|nr:MFS transporter [Agrobacterium sp. Ap1]
MTLGAFVLVSSEFMPMSLISPMASGLSVSEGQVGQAVSFSGILALLTSLFLSKVVGTLDRKTLLCGLTFLMVAACTLVAVAPNYSLVLVGRALLGISIGGFWSISTATVMRLVPGEVVPRALAILQGAVAFGTTVAAPLGSFLGGVVGWRGALFALVPVAIVALVWLMVKLPKLPVEPNAGRMAFYLLAKPSVCFAVAATLFLFAGQFAVFTYLRSFLEGVTKVDTNTLSALLLVMGVGSLTGSLLVSPILKRTIYGVIIAVPLLMAALALAMIYFGASVWGMGALLFVWGLSTTVCPVGWFAWLSVSLPNDAEAGGSLIVATMQLGLFVGATIGGMLLDHFGSELAFGFGAAAAVMSTVLAAITHRLRTN